MTTTELAAPYPLARALLRIRPFVYGASIFLAIFTVYAILAPHPIDSQHHVFLAQAMLDGSFDVGAAGMPLDYVDTLTVDGHRYVPFPPGPAFLLMPFVAVWGTDFSQSLFSAALGAVNVVLFWQILRTLRLSHRTMWLAVPFFAFGTVHLYTATTGAVWQYSHVAAVFFMLSAILMTLHKMPLPLVAFVFSFAVMSRTPTAFAAPFFLYYAFRQHEPGFSLAGLKNRETWKDVAAFSAGMAPAVLFYLLYNYARFDDPMDSGYQAVYETYVGGDQKYTFYQKFFPNLGPFKLFDVRNIPLHIQALFFMPPEFHADASLVQPSKYGMSVILTSPAFVYAFLVKRATPLKPACWLAVGFVALLLSTHYAQGWVQFGYRFLLDFAPFLLILTALGIEDNTSDRHRKWQVGLVAMSIGVCFWGLAWAHYGW